MISQTLSSIITNLSNAYDMALSMGATIPASRNMENLASTIGTIQAGGDDNLPAFLNDTLSEINDTAGEIKQVKAYAFYRTSLTKFNLPSCSNIGEAAFAYATTDLSLLSIPNCLYISAGAFRSCYLLSSISLPNCKGLYNQAMYSCSSLSQIDLPNCESIGTSAFQYCNLLSSVNAPNCTFIGSSAFANCVQLTEINASNLRMVDRSAFSACSRLETINTSKLFYIGEAAFQNCIALSNNYFQNCVSVESNPIPPNINDVSFPILESIRASAFQQRTNIHTFNAPCVTYLESYVFNGCYNMTSCFMPAVNYISSYAFQGCSVLSEFYTGASVIGSSAFRNCIGLSKMYILRCGIPTLSNQAFLGTLLSTTGSIYVPSSWVASFKTATNWTAFANNIYELPSELNSRFVFAREFAQQASLTEIPSEKANVEYVLAEGFSGCSLTSINLPSCKFVGSAAFANNFSTSFTSISLPLCEVMARSVFYNCKGASLFDLPNCKVYKDFGTYRNNYGSISLPECIQLAFGSMNLSYIDLPKCEFLEYLAACPALTSISLPECRYIKGNTSSAAVIMSCGNLTTLSLPNLVYLGGGSNFNYCSKLSQLIIGTNNPFPVQLGSSNAFGLYQCTFTNSTYLGYFGSIYVPDRLVSAYQTAQYWSSLSARITGISNLPSV